MNKAELINAVAASADCSKKDAEAVITAALDTITVALKEGDKVITSQYAGTKVTLEDIEYVVVRQNDILAIVE